VAGRLLPVRQVRLERDQTGWVLPDDVDPEPPIEPWAALLPALDPTALGWKEREFYLAPDFYSAIFDWSGNCGTTAWWNGRIAGAYRQDDAGRVELIVPRDPGPAGRAALRAQAERLQDWLDGEKVNAAYKSPLVTWDNHN
jgi:Winged helix DNA-binding domain